MSDTVWRELRRKVRAVKLRSQYLPGLCGTVLAAIYWLIRIGWELPEPRTDNRPAETLILWIVAIGVLMATDVFRSRDKIWELRILVETIPEAAREAAFEDFEFGDELRDLGVLPKKHKITS